MDIWYLMLFGFAIVMSFLVAFIGIWLLSEFDKLNTRFKED